MSDVVLAIGSWANNAELIRDGVVPLGYLCSEWAVLDPTFGRGRFWTLWQPTALVGSDLNPAKSPTGTCIDFTRLPHGDGTFDAVVFDPAYKLNGTSTGRGASSCDEDYGVEEWAGVAERHDLIRRGIDECVRVLRVGARADRTTGGYLLVKCQDQVNGGKVRWQTREFADHAESHPGVRLVDALHLTGYRAQPESRSQQHARRNYSTLLVFRKEPAPPIIPSGGTR